jgi:TRAP-type C4-dicarboxylate transport system permease small subunit
MPEKIRENDESGETPLSASMTPENDCAPKNPPHNPFDKIVVGFFSTVCFVSFILLTVIIGAATFVRYVLEGDLYGYEEVVKLLSFWLYFAGAAWGAYNRSHVSADLVQSFVPEGRVKRFLVFLKDLITVAVSLLSCGTATTYSVRPARSARERASPLRRRDDLAHSAWTSYLAIFTGLVFMAYISRRARRKRLRHAERRAADGEGRMISVSIGICSSASCWRSRSVSFMACPPGDLLRRRGRRGVPGQPAPALRVSRRENSVSSVAIALFIIAGGIMERGKIGERSSSTCRGRLRREQRADSDGLDHLLRGLRVDLRRGLRDAVVLGSILFPPCGPPGTRAGTRRR